MVSTPLKNIGQHGNLPPNRDRNKKCLKPPASLPGTQMTPQFCLEISEKTFVWRRLKTKKNRLQTRPSLARARPWQTHGVHSTTSQNHLKNHHKSAVGGRGFGGRLLSFWGCKMWEMTRTKKTLGEEDIFLKNFESSSSQCFSLGQ